MKIGIFEMEHFEGSYPVIQLFDMPANHLVIFTNADTYARFADLFKQHVTKFEWVILDTNTSRWLFFWKMAQAVRKRRLDIFYINTISSNHLLFAAVIALLRSTTRIVITLHDINCWFNSRLSMKLRQLLHHTGKKALIKQVREFNVVSDTMIEYLRTKTGEQKLIHNIPGAVFERTQASLAIGEYIHLVIPGTIEKIRRDYQQVFDLLNLAEAGKLPLHITLLGGHYDDYGKEIIQKAKSFKTGYTKLIVYDTGLVPQDEFDIQLDNAHFIFIPSVIHTAICFGIPEIYGISKSSGNIFDVIKHARPFIVPQPLHIPATLNSSCFKYESPAHLMNFLQQLFQHKEQYYQWQQQALANSKEYTIAKVRERNPSLFKTPNAER
jgi:hypothetical protein